MIDDNLLLKEEVI